MRLLAIDVGMGTSDILVYDSRLEIENCPKLVVPSATRVVAAQMREATAARRPILFTGTTMGGGPSGKALRQHLEAGLDIYADPAAALTFNDDLDLVGSWGVRVAEDPVAEARGNPVVIVSGDLDLSGLMGALERLNIDAGFDGAAVAVQDHGFAPGESNRRRRFQLWRESLAPGAGLGSLAWPRERIPEHYSRMRAVGGLLDHLDRTVVMDTGPAALWGVQAEAGPGTNLVVNLGNGHTLAAVMHGEQITGLMEHHTGMLDAGKLEGLLRRFAAGELTDDEVFEDGGHGCIPPEQPVELKEPLLVTGPRRALVRKTGLPFVLAAPHGDMMLSGCFGLVSAWKRVNADPSS